VARKRRLTLRADLELNGAAILYGHEHLDRQQFDTLGMITGLLQRLARGWAGTGGVTGLWYAIIGAAVHTGVRPPNATASGLADGARRQLERARRQLDGSRDLVIQLAEDRVPPLVLHVLDGAITPADAVALEGLRQGLDHLAGRRIRQARRDA
jgi:hypothetical protein